MEHVDEVLAGAVDMHVHCMMTKGWRWNLVEIAKKAIEANMGGIVLKDRYGASSQIAYFMNHLIGKELFFSSIVLNRWVGGLNSIAVKEFINNGKGISVVFMPTGHASNQLKKLVQKDVENAVRLFDGNEIIPELKEILSIIAQNDLVLATGHISPEESLLLIEGARNIGVKKILVTHASGIPVMASLDQQKEMCRKGALIEHCVVGCMPHYSITMKQLFGIDINYNTTEKIIENILEVGTEHCIVSTDLGREYNPDPVEGFKIFIKVLLDFGLTFQQVKVMVEDNPKKLLGIEKN